MHRAFRSRILGNRRDILVYLPPGYRRFSRKSYPVLYLHDGQNVFDAATSFGGVEWGVDETSERLIRTRIIEPVIVVAVANIGEDRVHEYTPTPGVIEVKGKRKKAAVSRGSTEISSWKNSNLTSIGNIGPSLTRNSPVSADPPWADL